MMQESTSFRNTIGQQFGQMWEMDGLKIKYAIHASLLYQTEMRDEALRSSAWEAVFAPNMTLGHLWYITKFSVIRHRPPGFDIHFLSIRTNQRSHSLCGPPVLKTGAMAQETNTERKVLKDTAQIKFVTVIFLSN